MIARMKFYNKSLLLLTAALGLASCTSEFKEYNADPYGVSDEVLSSGGLSEKLSSACAVLETTVIPQQENAYQLAMSLGPEVFSGYMGQTKHGALGRFENNSAWIQYPFVDNEGLPKLIKNYNAIATDTEADKGNIFYALATVLKVASMQRFTDMYGPMPYNFAGNAAQKPYQSQEEIYRLMVEDLSWAIQTLETTPASKAERTAWALQDKVYEGDFDKWLRYARSLKLRIAMHTANRLPEEAKAWVASVARKDLIDNNSYNAAYKTTDNPFFKMSHTWADTRVGADIVSYMVAFQDPRLPKYFLKTSRSGAAEYFGLRSGVNTPDKELLAAAGNYSMPVATQNDPIVWMTSAEVAFLLSEAALRGYEVPQTAEYYYQMGIERSMQQHGVSLGDYLQHTTKRGGFADERFPSFDDAAFQSSITVKWSTEGFDENLAQIITQKYIAMWPYGSMEAWTEWRRTGYPNLLPAKDYNKSIPNISRDGLGRDQGGMRRYSLPQQEYQTNKKNVDQAVADFLGGEDSFSTEQWWVNRN